MFFYFCFFLQIRGFFFSYNLYIYPIFLYILPCLYFFGIFIKFPFKGIVFQKNGEIVRNPFREIMDMDKLVFPYKNISLFEHKIIYYESSRGCPFSCAYCLSSIDKKLRLRDTEKVKKELQFFIDNKVPQVKFVDRTFNCKHDHAMPENRTQKEKKNPDLPFFYHRQKRYIPDFHGNFRRWELLGKPEQQQSGTNFLFRDRQSG